MSERICSTFFVVAISLDAFDRTDQELTFHSSGDPTTTRAVPWTEPMYDLKTPHSDAAWALDTLDAQEDSGFQENHEKLEHKGKKAIRPTRSAAKNICYAENEDGDVSEAIDEEAEKVENDQVENENEPEDGEGQDKNELDDEASHRRPTWLAHRYTDDHYAKGLTTQTWCLPINSLRV